MRRLLWLGLLGGCTAATTEDIEALTARVETLEADRDELQADRDALETSLADALARIDNLETEQGSIDSTVDLLVAERIDVQTTWTVGPGQDHATLQEAVAAAHEVRIGLGASLVLELANGTHIAEQGILLHHPDGVRLMITGSGSGNVTVQGTWGVDVARGYSLGVLRGLTFAQTEEERTGVGLRVSQGSFVYVDDLVIEGFGYGAFVDGGTVHAEVGGLTIHDSTVGVFARAEGRVEATMLDASDNATGVHAEYGALVHAPKLVVTGCTTAGVRAVDGAIVEAGSEAAGMGMDATGSYIGAHVDRGGVFLARQGRFADTTTSMGILVEGFSHARVAEATFEDLVWGITARHGSFVDARDAEFLTVTNPTTIESDAVVIGP